MADAIREGEVAQRLVLRALSDDRPAGRIDPRRVLRQASSRRARRRGNGQYGGGRGLGARGAVQGEKRGENTNARRPAVNRAYRTGGSDGGRIRACDTPDTSIFPARFPVPAPPVVVEPTPPPLQRRPRLAPALHRVIAERARHESLRDLAVAFEVSHETIRTIVRRTGLGRVAHPGCSSGTREARAPGLVSGGRTAPDRE